MGDEPPEGGEEKPKAPKVKPAQVLPPMKPGDRPALRSLEPVQHFTQPPPRYTEASLVKKLEREGIGRPSTYAAILATIQDRGYAHKLGGGGRGPFQPTPLGNLVTDRLIQFFNHSILDLGFTRLMETELDKIEEAHLDWKRVLHEFYGPFSQDLTKAAEGMVHVGEEVEQTSVKCPQCGAPMVKRLSRFGYYLRCSAAPECKSVLRLGPDGQVQERPQAQPTGLKCDRCGGAVVRSVGRFGPYLHCVKYATKECTYTMKLNKEGLPARKFRPLPTDRKCARCQSPLVVRVTSRDKKRRPFLSCSHFPKCRAALDLPPELAPLGEQALAQWHENEERNLKDRETYAAFQRQAPPPPGARVSSPASNLRSEIPDSQVGGDTRAPSAPGGAGA
jgi:DNA topoisomerase-1